MWLCLKMGSANMVLVTLGKEFFRLQLRSKVDRKAGGTLSLSLSIYLSLSLRRGALSPGEAPGRSPLTPEREDSGGEDRRREGSRREGNRRGSGREDSRREGSSRRSRSSSSSPARVTDVQSKDPRQVRQQCDSSDIYSSPLQARKNATQ